MALDPTEPIKRTLVFFKICGLWPQKRFYWAYIIYAIIFQTIFAFCYTGFKCINFFFITDVNSFTRELYICLSELSLFVKIINFHFYQNEIKDFLANIKAFKLLSNDEQIFLKERLSKFTKILIVNVSLCTIAIIFSCGAPFFAFEPVLPYPAWYPLDWRNDFSSYCLVYSYQVLGIIFEANAVILLESFVVYLMIVTGAHLDILAMRLTTLGYFKKESKIERGQINKSNLEFLTDCIDVHKRILKFQNSIESSFSIPFFVQFLVSGIILCISSFQIAIVSSLDTFRPSVPTTLFTRKIKPAEDVLNLVFYITFTVIMLMEIALPCYFGTENIFKSNYLTTAVYSSNWTEFPIWLQKIVMVFMEALMKPKILLSGKLFNLTMNSFLIVCNRSYSLLAVLKNFMK